MKPRCYLTYRQLRPLSCLKVRDLYSDLFCTYGNFTTLCLAKDLAQSLSAYKMAILTEVAMSCAPSMEATWATIIAVSLASIIFAAILVGPGPMWQDQILEHDRCSAKDA